jgi:hypothetical protein
MFLRKYFIALLIASAFASTVHAQQKEAMA